MNNAKKVKKVKKVKYEEILDNLLDRLDDDYLKELIEVCNKCDTYDQFKNLDMKISAEKVFTQFVYSYAARSDDIECFIQKVKLIVYKKGAQRFCENIVS